VLFALHGQAPVRARLLVAIQREGGGPDGYEERLTEATVFVTARRLPRRHGRRLLLGRLPAAWIRSAQLRDYLVREIGQDWWGMPRPAIACARCSWRNAALE